MTPAIAMLLDTVAKAKGKKKLVEGKGAWQHAKDEAKKRGKGDSYAAAIAAKICGKSKALDVLSETIAKASQGSERPGHKYLSRKRQGDRWVYTYADSGEKQDSGPSSNDKTDGVERAENTNPRKAAEIQQKADDAGEYEFARESKFANKGEDLKNSARHKVNAWRGLDHAEADGSAEKIVKRDTLLKLDPPDFMSHLTDTNAACVLAAWQILRRFPPAPSADLPNDADKKGAENIVAYVYDTPDARTGGRREHQTSHNYENVPDGWKLKRTVTKGEILKKARADYIQVFDRVKAKAEGAAVSSTDPLGVIRTMRIEVTRAVNDLDRDSPIGHQIASYLSGPLGAGKASVAAEMRDFYQSTMTPAQKTEAVRNALEGATIANALGQEKKSEGRAKRFKVNEADLYLGKAEREGPSVRGAATFKSQEQMLLDKARIRGLQWGNSVTDAEREHHLRYVNDSFHDLTTALNLPPALGSFNGRLGLAIGARGIARAMAHYESDTRVINLTRKNGVGTLAHEWSHFFDNILGELHGSGDKSLLTDTVRKTPHKANTPVSQAVSKLINGSEMDAFRKRIQQEPLFSEMTSQDKAYWSSAPEIWARSFEKYITHKLAEKGQKNTYLSGVAPSPLWPTADETKALAPLFDAVFDEFKKSDMLHKALSLNLFVGPTTPAIALMRETIAKAGEGSRGGRVVGHSPSGNAQYASHGPVIGKTSGRHYVFRDAPASHPLYTKMTQQDHVDAHKIHVAHDGDKHGHGLSHWASVRAKKAV